MSPRKGTDLGSARLGLPIALGLVAALLFLSTTREAPHGAILGFLAPVPLMAAALGLGQASTGLAGVVGIVACALVAGTPMGGVFAMVVSLPALVVSNRALRTVKTPQGGEEWYPAGSVLCWLAVCAAVVFVAVTAGLVATPGSALSGHPDGIRVWLEKSLSDTLNTLGDQITPDERQNLATVVSAVLPAMIMGTWLVMSSIGAVAAQGILSRLGFSLRPSPSYVDLDLPIWSLALPVCGGLAWGVTHGDIAYVAANVAGVGLLPFAMLGVAVVHGAFTRGRLSGKPGSGLGLVAFYLTLLLFSGWALVPMAVMGLARFIRVGIDRRAAEKRRAGKRGEMENGSHSAGAD